MFANMSTGEIAAGSGHTVRSFFNVSDIRLTVSRFVFTDPEMVQQKISQMAQRIRQLEDALTLLQSSISSEKHPLLREDLLSIKFRSETERAGDALSPDDIIAETIDAFGTLAVGDSGESKYFGRSGGSEVRESSAKIGR